MDKDIRWIQRFQNFQRAILLLRDAFENDLFVEVRAGYTSVKGKIEDIDVDNNSGIMFYVKSKYQGMKIFYLIDQTIRIKRAKIEKY